MDMAEVGWVDATKERFAAMFIEQEFSTPFYPLITTATFTR
jgi:hypothetical protein